MTYIDWDTHGEREEEEQARVAGGTSEQESGSESSSSSSAGVCRSERWGYGFVCSAFDFFLLFFFFIPSLDALSSQ